jgi:pimeloyl-ACP methyl ester carboxylesterase
MRSFLHIDGAALDRSVQPTALRPAATRQLERDEMNLERGRSARLMAALAPAMLTLAACSPIPAPPVSPAAASTPTMDGMVDIGGLSLHIHCIGEGVPIVVLDSGLGLTGEAWDDVQPEVSRFTRVCAYDRAGRGYSSPAPKPHSNRQMARELGLLLERAGQPGPYVLVGHSMGGMNARLFASDHADRVAGMVLVDAVGDGQPSRYWALMPDASMAELRGMLDKLPEGLDLDTWTAGFADMRDSSRSIGNVPLVVLSHGREGPPPRAASPEQAAKLRVAWQEMQTDLAKLSTNAVHVTAPNSGHNMQWEAPRLVIGAIHEVVNAARAHGRVNAAALLPLANGAVSR